MMRCARSCGILFALLLGFALVSRTALGVADVGPEWTFDGPDAEKELQTWGAINQLKPLKIETVKDKQGEKRDVLVTESTGPDPYMFPGGDWNNASYEPFDGKKNNILYLGVRVNQANRWQIYYVTVAQPAAWGEALRQNFDVPFSEDFQDLEIELTRGGWDESEILRFRIDPGTAAGVVAEIDYISFVGPPQGAFAVAPRDKLTTTWAALKASP